MQQSYGDWFIAITCKVILLKQLLLICFIYEKLKKKKARGAEASSFSVKYFFVFLEFLTLVTG